MRKAPESPDSFRWTAAQHEAAAAALGYFAALMIDIAHETTEDRLSVYLLTIRWATQHAARHAAEALAS